MKPTQAFLIPQAEWYYHILPALFHCLLVFYQLMFRSAVSLRQPIVYYHADNPERKLSALLDQRVFGYVTFNLLCKLTQDLKT